MTIIPASLAFAAPLARYVASPAYGRFCRRVHRDPRPWFDLADEVQRERLRQALHLVPGERWVDLGCGAGALVAWLGGESPGTKGFGLDLALAAMAGRVRRGVAGDLARLPFADDFFDAAVAVDSLYFLSGASFRRAVAEAVRCLRPAGRLVALVSDIVPAGAPSPTPGGTRLGGELEHLGWVCDGCDLTEREAEVWRRKSEALADLREAFHAEGNGDLWRSLEEETRLGRGLMAAGRARRVLLWANHP